MRWKIFPKRMWKFFPFQKLSTLTKKIPQCNALLRYIIWRAAFNQGNFNVFPKGKSFLVFRNGEGDSIKKFWPKGFRLQDIPVRSKIYDYIRCFSGATKFLYSLSTIYVGIYSPRRGGCSIAALLSVRGRFDDRASDEHWSGDNLDLTLFFFAFPTF